MMQRSLLTAVAALGLTLSAGMALADQTGKEEYLKSCAVCHGDTGMGDGPLAEIMTVPVPDLTKISASNDGQFPMLKVIQTIDGRSGTRGHGYPMPIWGSRMKAEVSGEMGDYGAELEVRGRILSIALYLESIQQ